MSKPCVILCTNDESLVVDLKIITDVCPPILKRFLGIGEDIYGLTFAAPARDDIGRLTFAKEFGISRSCLQSCVTFLKSGYVHSLETLVRTMDILGGSDKLDAYVVKKNAEEEALKALAQLHDWSDRLNPMTPKEDIDLLFIWRARCKDWSTSDEWSATSRDGNTIIWWWRKRKGPKRKGADF